MKIPCLCGRVCECVAPLLKCVWRRSHTLSSTHNDAMWCDAMRISMRWDGMLVERRANSGRGEAEEKRGGSHEPTPFVHLPFLFLSCVCRVNQLSPSLSQVPSMPFFLLLFLISIERVAKERKGSRWKGKWVELSGRDRENHHVTHSQESNASTIIISERVGLRETWGTRSSVFGWQSKKPWRAPHIERVFECVCVIMAWQIFFTKSTNMIMIPPPPPSAIPLSSQLHTHRDLSTRRREGEKERRGQLLLARHCNSPCLSVCVHWREREGERWCHGRAPQCQCGANTPQVAKDVRTRNFSCIRVPLDLVSACE